MITKLILLSGMLFTAEPAADLYDLSMKDDPPQRPAIHRTRPARVVTPTLPERNTETIQPYVYIQGGGDIRVPMSALEMEIEGFATGQTITLKDAHRIITERLEREGK
jgi:hypothetical protein